MLHCQVRRKAYDRTDADRHHAFLRSFYTRDVRAYHQCCGTSILSSSNFTTDGEQDYLLFPEDAPISDAAIQLMTACVVAQAFASTNDRFITRSMLRPAEERLGRYFGAAEYQSHAYFANFDFDRLHESASRARVIFDYSIISS